MNAHETLAKIVDGEAQKLLEKSLAAKEPLAGVDLEALEILSRCVKALRSASPAKPVDDEPADVPELLRAAT